MSTSIKAGVSYLRDRARAIVVSPGDMAYTTTRLYEAVLDEYATSKSPIVVAAYNGRNGHPILFDRVTFSDLLKISEEKRGMKEVLEKFRGSTVYVETGTPRALLDIDYEADLARAAKELEHENDRP
jgi:CTP:molybdopterin cytidylyltransferase MocA